MDRPHALKQLEVSLQLSRKIVDMYKNNDPRYSHLEQAEVEKCAKAINESESWLEHTREILHSVKGHMPAPIKVPEIIQQRLSFEEISFPIIHKGKPKVVPPKEEAQSSGDGETTSNNTDANAPPAPAGNAEMEVE